MSDSSPPEQLSIDRSESIDNDKTYVNIDEKTGYIIHEVRDRDTLAGIAISYGTTVCNFNFIFFFLLDFFKRKCQIKFQFFSLPQKFFN